MPVVGCLASDITARANYFKGAIERQLSARSMNGLDISYHDKIHDVMAHVYFALSEAYKRVYIKIGNKTDTAKRAALTCATVSVVKPLRPPDNLVVTRDEYIYMNSLLAMRMACEIINHPFHRRSFDDQRRILRAIDLISFPCVQRIMDEALASNGQILGDHLATLSSDEEGKLNLLIDDFVMYERLKIADQEHR